MTPLESLNPLQPGETPDWLIEAEQSEEARVKLVASKIAAVLDDSKHNILLETLYEGTSFTPTIGQEVGFESGVHDLNPVREAIKELRDKKVLEFERNEIEVQGMALSLIRVMFNADLAQDFRQPS